jgi:Chaperone of endosialidase
MGTVVHVNAAGQLGTAPSSQRFKDQIEPMDKASEAILALKPVTFRYKREIDPERSPHFGLIAEEVDKVCPDLVGRDAKGQIDYVSYKAVNAMLLNEFLKEHKRVQQQAGKIEEQDRKLEQQEATITQLKKGMEVLTASLKEQGAQIRKVADQLEL